MPPAFANPTLPWELVPLGICTRSSSLSRDRIWIYRWSRWPFADLGAMSQTELYTFTWDATHFHGADLIPLFCSSPRDCPNIKILRVYQQRMWNKIKRRPDGAPNWTILPCCGICLCFMTELNSSNYQLIILSERGIIESWQVRCVLRTIFHVWQPLWVRTMLLQIIWCGGLRAHDYSVTLLFGFIIIKLKSTNTWLIKYNYNRLSRN